MPWLYLKGISTGDFPESLQALLGLDAKGLSANVIVKLKDAWNEEFKAWQKRDLSQKEYVYVWADGIYCNVRLDDERQCILVLMGATKDGTKELIAVRDGYRESEQSWKEILLDLKAHGFKVAPKLATGDGALGFWAALRKVWPATREQRCWFHKTGNVLNALPKSMLSKAKADLHEIWLAETRKAANKAFDAFRRSTRRSTRIPPVWVVSLAICETHFSATNRASPTHNRRYDHNNTALWIRHASRMYVGLALGQLFAVLKP